MHSASAITITLDSLLFGLLFSRGLGVGALGPLLLG